MKTLADFRFHIQLHRKRVVRLGLALARHHFPEIHPLALESFLWLHDRSKTLQTPQQLSGYGYTHPQLPAERLFQFYGVGHRSSEQTQELRQIVQDINIVDEKIAGRYFTASGAVNSETTSIFYNIEKVADLVDRSLDPIAAEEFGHPMILASEYIQDPYLSKMSLWLEDQYGKLTENLSFPTTPILKKVD